MEIRGSSRNGRKARIQLCKAEVRSEASFVLQWAVMNESFVGGVRFGKFLGGANWSWPLARLTVGPGEVLVSLRGPFKSRRISFRPEEVDYVEWFVPSQKIWYSGPVIGFRFSTGDKRDGTTFWAIAGDDQRIASALHSAGIRVVSPDEDA